MSEIIQASLRTRGGDAVLLQGVSIEGDLRGALFEACVEQRFSNSTQTNIEVVYTFPLPWKAVLLGVDVLLGDKHLSGSVQAKAQATQRYEAAMTEGDAAIMLERNHDESYCLNLGNLLPGETCIIRLRYAQLIPIAQRSLRVLIPTVIAPRYGNPITQGGLQPHQVPQHSIQAQYPFALKLRLHGELAAARIGSPSHAIQLARHPSSDETNHAIAEVSLARHSMLDRDLVLTVDELTQDSLAQVARDEMTGESVVLMNCCPRITADKRKALAVKVLVDCSGSMAGDSIAAARRALHAIIAQLDEIDHFSLSRFGNDVAHRSRAPWLANARTRAAAARWIDALDADMGGTEMENALQSTFALSDPTSEMTLTHAEPREVLLITDGEIYGIDSVIQSARQSGHRIFVVAIGSSPAESHLRRLAEATGGACDFVAPGEAVEPAVLRMFARLRSPYRHHIALQWPEGMTPVYVSPLPASIFDQDSFFVFARLSASPTTQVMLTGCTTADGEAETISAISLTATAAIEETRANTLARMEASCRLHDLSQTLPETAKQSLAVRYQLVTESTNFILVHVRAEQDKPADMPSLHTVAQMMPAGWGGLGSVNGNDPFDMQKESVLSDRANVHAFAAAPVHIEECAAPDIAPAAALAARPMPPAPPMRSVSATSRKRSKAAPGGKLSSHTGLVTGNDGTATLTPEELQAWLRQHPQTQWPRSYAQLHQMGVEIAVVDWLELVIAPLAAQSDADGEQLAERVITHFLQLVVLWGFAQKQLALPTAVQASLQPSGWIERLRRWLQPLAATNAAVAAAIERSLSDPGQQALFNLLSSALAEAQAEAWPDTMYALTAPQTQARAPAPAIVSAEACDADSP